MSKELQRLIRLAKEFGVRTKIYNVKGSHGTDGTYSAPTKSTKALIEIYRNKSYTQKYVAVIFLHELGHHMDYLDRKRIPDAYLLIENDTVPKWARRAILNTEMKAIAYAEQLYHTLGFCYPYWKFKRECDHDRFIYQYFYKHGRWAKKKEVLEFYRNWDKKYKKALASK